MSASARHSWAGSYRFHSIALAAAVALLGSGGALAQFDATRVWVEPPAVAARFPDPSEIHATPGLAAGRSDFTSQAEMIAFVDALAAGSPHVRVERLGLTQQGREMVLLLLADDGRYDPARPTVMVIGQQHGNEPAG